MNLSDNILNRYNKGIKELLANNSEKIVRIISKYHYQEIPIEETLKRLEDCGSPESIALNKIISIYYQVESFYPNEEVCDIKLFFPLEVIELDSDYPKLLKILHRMSKDKRVLIKPNIVSNEKYPETSSLERLKDILLPVKSVARKVAIGDGPSFFFDSSIAIDSVKNRFPDEHIIDFNKSKYFVTRRDSWTTLSYVQIPEEVRCFDLLINLCNLKEHTCFDYSGSKKNLMGLVSPATRLILHRLPQERRERSLEELSELFQYQIGIMDATKILIGGQQKAYGGQERKGFGIIYSTNLRDLDDYAKNYLRTLRLSL